MLYWIAEQIVLYWDIFRYLIPAVPRTALITITSFALALVLGMIVSIIRIWKIPVLSFLAGVYVNVIRGVPLLVHIFFIYFGLGKYLNFDRFTAGVLAPSCSWGTSSSSRG